MRAVLFQSTAQAITDLEACLADLAGRGGVPSP
jgi:hypothetical protein